jgi:hypothetical protein
VRREFSFLARLKKSPEKINISASRRREVVFTAMLEATQGARHHEHFQQRMLGWLRGRTAKLDECKHRDQLAIPEVSSKKRRKQGLCEPQTVRQGELELLTRTVPPSLPLRLATPRQLRELRMLGFMLTVMDHVQQHSQSRP